MERIDLRQRLRHLYDPEPGSLQLVEVPRMNFVAIEGAGEPSAAPEFREAIETLRYLSFALIFNLRERRPDLNYAVMPFEALIWQDEPAAGGWKWQAMVLQPDDVTREFFAETTAEVIESKMGKAIGGARFVSVEEGLAVQTLHQGGFDDGGRTAREMQAFIEREGYEPAGVHHEIYLNDPLRTRFERRRTILRQPVRAQNSRAQEGDGS
ncbi:MAG: GyrI-like domain-containing protein [Alphaproteobacteria bacterium]